MDGMQIVSNSRDWGVPVWKFDSPPDFYRSIDYLLVPSLIEGGPVPFMEALACGTLSISPPIGVVPDFQHIEYETGNIESLKEVIRTVKREFLENKQALTGEIEKYNWRHWADEHEKLFRRLVEEKKQ